MFGFAWNDRRKKAREEAAERRLTPRGRVLLGGKIVYGPGFTADCAIRDLSRGGACVRMADDQAPPPEFYLIVVRDGVAHKARTTWRRAPLVGLEFESSHDLAASTSPHLTAMRNLWCALAPRGAGRPMLAPGLQPVL